MSNQSGLSNTVYMAPPDSNQVSSTDSETKVSSAATDQAVLLPLRRWRTADGLLLVFKRRLLQLNRSTIGRVGRRAGILRERTGKLVDERRGDFSLPTMRFTSGIGLYWLFRQPGSESKHASFPSDIFGSLVYHLHAHTSLAKALSEKLHAALSSFYVPIACQTRLIHRSFTSEEADAMFEEISHDDPFHLAVVFMTEGDPQGGWWHTSQHGHQRDGRVPEGEFLDTCLHNLRKMARRALTARVFGIACGFNLRVKGSLTEIVTSLQKTNFTTLVMPSTCSLLMCEYVMILPEIFINLYYFGSRLEPTLLRVWGKSKQTRLHTGLLLVERNPAGAQIDVRTFTYAPVATRPIGVSLPLARTVCGCPTAEWDYKTTVKNTPEKIYIYQSKCCKVELHVAIHADGRQERTYHEVSLVMERWNEKKARFMFTESRNVSMRTKFPEEEGRPARVDKSGMWTISGRRAVAKHLLPSGGQQ